MATATQEIRCDEAHGVASPGYARRYQPMHRATLVYSKPLVRRAVLHFWWRVVGLRFLAALALVAIGLGGLVYGGDSSWLVGVLASVLALGILFAAALYVVHSRSSLRALAAMGNPSATLEACAASLSIASGAGAATLPWSSITEIWRFETCWLLLLSRAQFLTLPLVDLAPDAAAFILERVRTAGGRVTG
jgi:YcxB-like protein